MHTWKRTWFMRFTAAVLLCAAALLCTHAPSSCEAAEFVGDWKYCEGSDADTVAFDRIKLHRLLTGNDWKSFSFSQTPKLSPDSNNIWVTITLSPEHGRKNTLFFTTSGQSFRVWLGEQVIYEYGKLRHSFWGHGWRWHRIVLPQLKENTPLSLQIYGDDPKLLGEFHHMSLDTEAEQAKSIYMGDLPYLTTLPVTLILLVIMTAYYVKHIAWSKLCFAVIIFLLEFLFWLLAASNSKFLFLDYPVFWWYALSILGYMLPIALHVIAYEIVEPYLKSWMHSIILSYVGLLLLAIAGEMAGLHGFDRCISLYYLMVVFLEPIAFILVLSSASGGNAYSRSMAVPLLGFTALSLMDGFSMYFNVFEWQNFFTAFSVYFLAVFVLGILYEQFAQEKRLFMDARLLKNEMKEATELSSYDTLTKCYNRTRLNELLQRGLADSYDNGRPFAMLMFDLDHFKSFNDTFGHEMGDAVLAGFAGVVRQCTLSGQSFIRWGGEEFVLFCPECPISSAILLANVIRCRVMLTELCKERQVTCSIGITLWRGAGDSKETMFERADRALYKAKNNGRNRVEVEL